MRLDKFLVQVELGSRSQVKDYIKKGRIAVNSAIVNRPEFQIDEMQDSITCDGRSLQYSQYYYYMLHKPAGVITATKDAHEPTVMSLLTTATGKNLSPVGRLDKDTEGLLLITNDGDLSHQLLSPKKHVAKTYYVECQGIISEEKLENLRNGIDIGDEKDTLPAKAELLSQDTDKFCLNLTITEGRFHQVKRMIHAIGAEVAYLKRISMGSLTLDPALPKGEYRALTKEEIEQLYQERK